MEIKGWQFTEGSHVAGAMSEETSIWGGATSLMWVETKPSEHKFTRELK